MEGTMTKRAKKRLAKLIARCSLEVISWSEGAVTVRTTYGSGEAEVAASGKIFLSSAMLAVPARHVMQIFSGGKVEIIPAF